MVINRFIHYVVTRYQVIIVYEVHTPGSLQSKGVMKCIFKITAAIDG